MPQPAFSPDGRRALQAFEGDILKGYYDAVGVPTIATGHTAATGELIHYSDGTTTTKVIIGKRITQAESDRLLAVDVAGFVRQIDRLVTVQLTTHQHDAIVSFAYNVGIGNFSRSSALRLINQSRFDEVPDALALYNKAGGRVLSGLVRRRDAEGKMFMSPDGAVVAANDNYGVMASADEPTTDTPAAPQGILHKILSMVA